MRGIRYEFGGTGIFHALEMFDDCDLEQADAEDIAWAEEYFERELHATNPSSDIGADYALTFFFTEEGVHNFIEPLETLKMYFIQYLEDAGFGEFNRIELDIDTVDIVYQDKHQFAIQKDRYDQIVKGTTNKLRRKL